MDFTEHMKLSTKELEQFSRVCNKLLGETFLCRSVYHSEKGRINNPDYYFLSGHMELISDYLSLCNWKLYHESHYGYFYIENHLEANRMQLNKEETAILLILRLCYEEKELGLENDILLTVEELLEKLINEFHIIKRPSFQRIQSCLQLYRNHNIIQKIAGSLGKPDGVFAIMPCILTVVSSDRVAELVKSLEKETNDEEDDEDSSGELAVL